MQTTEYKKAKVNKLRNSHLEDGFRQTVKNKKTTVHCQLSCRQWKSSTICSMLGKSVCIVPCLDNIYKQTQIPFLTVALYTKALLLTKMLLCFHAIFLKKKERKRSYFFYLPLLTTWVYYLRLLILEYIYVNMAVCTIENTCFVELTLLYLPASTYVFICVHSAEQILSIK